MPAFESSPKKEFFLLVFRGRLSYILINGVAPSWGYLGSYVFSKLTMNCRREQMLSFSAAIPKLIWVGRMDEWASVFSDPIQGLVVTAFAVIGFC